MIRVSEVHASHKQIEHGAFGFYSRSNNCLSPRIGKGSRYRLSLGQLIRRPNKPELDETFPRTRPSRAPVINLLKALHIRSMWRSWQQLPKDRPRSADAWTNQSMSGVITSSSLLSHQASRACGAASTTPQFRPASLRSNALTEKMEKKKHAQKEPNDLQELCVFSANVIVKMRKSGTRNNTKSTK